MKQLTPEERREPSRGFISIGRNPDLPPPAKVERTEKRPGDVVISTVRAPNNSSETPHGA